MRPTASIGRRWPAILVGAAVSASVALAAAQSPAVQRGLTFVRVHCAQCHSIDAVSESSLKIAPPFRDLHRKYPIESLRRPLSEGIIANHPTMPQFRLEADQVNDVIAFMQSLER
jgi:cytochrome c